jgi:diguanylate cyclase (GGDEF)-like protein
MQSRLAFESGRLARYATLRAAGHHLSVILLDIDHFKKFNDRFGHQAGDELLKQVAQALMMAVREQDTVARVGGDEFYVLAPETDRVGGERLEARVRSAIGGVTTGLDSLSASVGFAIFPEDAEDPATLVEVADAAAMVAKREHKLESQAA